MDSLTEFQEDVFADVLQSVHLQSALYCRAHLSAPWGLGVPRWGVAVFHLSSLRDGQAGWWTALTDPPIGQALALIHHQPEEHWTVESLARRVGLSRSALSAKFTRLVGRPPLGYLTDVRLTKAAASLRTQPATLNAVALSVGCDSEVAFSKAFKRHFGAAPGAYRRARRPPRPTS